MRFTVSSRQRFIYSVTALYVVGALLWIFLSDQLLSALTDWQSIVWLSTAKGVFFVITTAALFFWGLRSVPAGDAPSNLTLINALTSGLSQQRSRWPMYLVATIITLSTLALHLVWTTQRDPMLILFMLPIVLSATLGGMGPGLLATALAAISTEYCLIPPVFDWHIGNPNNLLQWGFMVVNGVAVSVLSEMLQQAINRAEAKRQLLDAVISGTSDAIFVKDLQGRYQLANQATAGFLGKPVSDILGQDDYALLGGTSAQIVKDRDHAVMASGATHTHEERLTLPDGSVRDFSVTKGPILNQLGQIGGIFGISRDITEAKQIAHQNRLNQQRFEMAIEATSDGLWDWDLRTGKVYRSPQYYAVTGYVAAEDTHDLAFFRRLVHPDDLPGVVAAIDAHRKGLSAGLDFEFRLQTRSGDIKWMHTRGRATEFNSDGSVARIVGILSDISEKKQAAAALREQQQRLSRVVEGSDQGYWDWNVQTQQFEVSARWEEMLGYRPGEMDVSVGNWNQLVHPDDLPLAMSSIQRHLSGNSASHEAEFRARTKDGGWRWILTRGRVVQHSADGRPLIMSGTHTDITERKEFELAQREASTVFESSYEGIMVVSAGLKITKINPAFTRITGYTADEVLGQPPSILSSGQQDPAYYRNMWESVLHKTFWSGEIWNRRKSGELYAELLSISAVRNSAGEIEHYVGVFSDISQLKAHEAELDRIAHYDPLTGTPNRRLLTDRMEQAIARATRSGRALAVCFIDLDGFKQINDRLGHAAGDSLLVGVAHHLQHMLRSEDTLARLGGDEFVVLLSDIATPEECMLILDRVLQAITRPVQVEGEAISVTASIGVSLYPTDNSDADALLRHADQAMYLAKEAGKNRYHLFDPEADRQVQEHRRFLDSIQQALENNELVLYYQPKVHLRSGQLVGVEALIRWQHPERGLLPPAQFLPAVDGSPLEQPVGVWVLRTALAQGASWAREGRATSISVNISADHLLHGSFFSQLQTLLAEHTDMPPALLELEVLETAALADMEQAITILLRCRELGVHFALDDFGTGYSSLTYLRQLPVDMLKIDQSFIRDILSDPDDRGIVEGIIRLAGACHRGVIAEGVETLEHGAALLQLGCELAQGYGVARPMPASELFDWLARWQQEQPWTRLPPWTDGPERGVKNDP
ncbi:EAL domain-containing protein [Duganella qianjiadongensis]|uniref:EAL domain-containing protein n=1 Tax=Duganella qianjiadongensis TaxID=2692176 RepID=A0ABW9VH10_9BURK|nr:EAL domain-containing protein [Duganella qianjiadongensis]MYM38780.1 EAL domain-containing protein [Duganella qianjiadongensis]